MTMLKLIGVMFGVGLAFAGTAFAADLQGHWQFQRLGHNGTYFGHMVVDQRGQVRLKGTSPTQNYAECGYVRANGEKIEIIFTFAKGERGYSADHFYCTLSGGTLACRNQDIAGNGDPTVFNLMRIGGIPATPAERLEDACVRGQV